MENSTRAVGPPDPLLVQEKEVEYSQNWKLLQKQLQIEATASSSSSFTQVVSKKKKKLKRKAEFHQKLLEGATAFASKTAKLDVVSTESDEITQTSSGLELTRVLAIDCEYVGGGDDGRTNILARVSIVNSEGHCVFDKYVKPTEKVTDYRTAVSGIRAPLLINGIQFKQIQHEVNKMLAGRIIVGHALHNDFKVLNLSHSRRDTRDTAKWHHLRVLAAAKSTPSLKFLAEKLLGVNIQRGEHCSIADAQTAMQIYLMHKKKWESDLRRQMKKR